MASVTPVCTFPRADFDDTLVQTSDHDLRAWKAVREMAASKLPDIDGEQLITDFKALFKTVPWDPDYKVSFFPPMSVSCSGNRMPPCRIVYVRSV